MVCWHQFVCGDNFWPCPVLVHDPESSNDMLGHSSVIFPHLLNADEDLTAK
jgi:hypothetical protein